MVHERAVEHQPRVRGLPPAAGHRWRLHRRLPRAPRGWLLGLIVGLGSAVVNVLLVTFVATGDLLDRARTRPGAGVRRDRVPALADLRCAVRLRGRVVPPLPAAVGPEPRQAGRGEEEGVTTGSRGRPARPEGRRPPLTSLRARPRRRALSPAGASPRGPAGGRRRAVWPADPARHLGERPDLAGDHVDHAPSRWRSPSTSSSAWRRTTPRSRAQASGQSVTLTIPVSSSRARKTVPLAVIGCWRVTTSPPIRTGPGRRSEQRRVGHRPEPVERPPEQPDHLAPRIERDDRVGVAQPLQLGQRRQVRRVGRRQAQVQRPAGHRGPLAARHGPTPLATRPGGRPPRAAATAARAAAAPASPAPRPG